MAENIFDEYEISNPYCYKNLKVFIICGKDRSQGKNFFTLQEAMEQGKFLVKETGIVDELIVESFFDDKEVFIQSGDIVKGGKQDRTFRFDYIVPPKSTIKAATFCVEKQRWSQRGVEKVSQFSHSTNRVTSNLTGQIKRNVTQDEVWKRVGKAQENLTGSLGRSVRSNQSASSLQLTLEEPVVQDNVTAYTQLLAPIINNHPNAIGYVFVVNNKISGGDIYISYSLFRKLWLKLLKVGILDAITEKQNSSSVKQIAIEDIKNFLDTKDKDFQFYKAETSPITNMHTLEFEDKTRYDTVENTTFSYIHSNYVTK